MGRHNRESNGPEKHRHMKQSEAQRGKPGLTEGSASWFQLQACIRSRRERIHSRQDNNNGREYDEHGGSQEHASEIEQTDHECTQSGTKRPGNRPSRTHHGGSSLGHLRAHSIKMPFSQGKKLRKHGEADAERQTSDQKE